MGELRVSEVHDWEAWDEFVGDAEGGTFCHLSGWRELLESELGVESLYRVVEDDEGRIEGLLPLARVRSLVFGHYLISLPFLNYGGALGSPGARSLLAEWALGEAERSRADLLELRSRGQIEPGGGLRVVERRLTVVLDLPAESEELWTSFPSKLRSQIRRPMKDGMRVEFGPSQVDAFHEVFSRNMRDLGTPTLPRQFFSGLSRHLGDLVIFGAVYKGEEPVAGGCGFSWSGEFEMTWASSLREYNASAPNMLLYWSFMEESIRRGCGTFNFGRCAPGGGTHRFKRQWGGADEPLRWGQWSARGLSAPPAAERPVFQAATSVWRRLPLAVTNRVGPLLARRLP